MTIGSFAWRTMNYGLVASCRYLFFYPRQLKRINLSDKTKIWEIPEFAYQIGVDQETVDESRALIQNLLKEYNFRIAEIEMHDKAHIKSAGKKGSVPIRLMLISLILLKFRINLFIESGTQHGISAMVAHQTLQKSLKDIRGTVVTLDVTPHVMPLKSDEINYIQVKSPVRNNWKKALNEFKLSDSSILFFHDSDHSYENMYFEINWALRSLRADVIISDDVDGNRAFIDIALSSNLPFYVIGQDGEPNVGVIFNV